MAEHWAHNSYFPANFDKVKLAHCLAGAAAWVILFPLGAILLRTLNSPRAVRVHYIIQICATCIFIACVGMGIWMAKWIHKLDATHSIIGLVIFAVAILQAGAGSLQHVLFKKGRKTWPLNVIHVWTGRLCITVAIINGGLGLQLDDYVSRTRVVTYSVIAGLMWITFVLAVTLYPRRRTERESKEDFQETGCRMYMKEALSPIKTHDPRCTCGMRTEEEATRRKEVYVIGHSIDCPSTSTLG